MGSVAVFELFTSDQGDTTLALLAPIGACDGSMACTKDQVHTIRTSAEVKALPKLATRREHRQASSMIEVLVLGYAEAHGLAAPASNPPGTPGSNTTNPANDPE